jgi:hypothetical protein
MVDRAFRPAVALLVFASCGGRTELPTPADPKVVAAPEAGPDTARGTVPPDAAPASAPDLGPPDLARAGSPVLALTPQQHDFGTTPVGTVTDLFVFTLFNTGDGVATGPPVVILTGDFALPAAGHKCAGLPSLPPGGSCTMAVMFRPQSRGMKTGLLLVSTGSQEARATLAGRGGGEGSLLAIQPNQVQLSATTGVASAPQRMTVVNVGGQPTGPLSIALGGADASSFVLRNSGCLTPLAPASTCTLELVLLATTAGIKSATLTASSPSGGMAVAMLTGVVRHPIRLAFASAMHDFGSVAVGTVSTARVLVLSNVQAGVTPPLTVMTSTTEFRIEASTCPGAVLTGGATCTISLVFQPISRGSKTAVVTASAGPNDTAQASLSGIGF